jgi:hypothetical protein
MSACGCSRPTRHNISWISERICRGDADEDDEDEDSDMMMTKGDMKMVTMMKPSYKHTMIRS